MTQGIVVAIDHITTMAGTLTGIRQSFSGPPGSVNMLPCVVVYPKRGTTELISAGFAESHQTICCQFFVSRAASDDKAIDKLMTFQEPMQKALRDGSNLGSTVDTIKAIRNELLWADYGTIKTAILSFEIDVKITLPA